MLFFAIKDISLQKAKRQALRLIRIINKFKGLYERRVQKIKANYDNFLQKSTKLSKDINA